MKLSRQSIPIPTGRRTWTGLDNRRASAQARLSPRRGAVAQAAGHVDDLNRRVPGMQINDSQYTGDEADALFVAPGTPRAIFAGVRLRF